VRVLVTGGTGTLGRAFIDAAAETHAEDADLKLRVMSRSPEPEALPAGREWARADLASGEGLEAAVRGVDVILHAATDPRPFGSAKEVDVAGTRSLLEAAAGAGVGHVVYPSIVGIDRMPYFYYDVKVEAESIVEASAVPHTTVRITQFHGFVDAILSGVGKVPLVMSLPTRARLQSIAVEDAAAHLVTLARGAPAGHLSDVGGPEVLELGEMARSWCRVQGKRRWIVRVPLPGELARGFREGRATVPDGRVGEETWEAWLERRYGEETEGVRG